MIDRNTVIQGLAVILGLPLVTIVLGELIERCKRQVKTLWQRYSVPCVTCYCLP